jgi:hypothetical protein
VEYAKMQALWKPKDTALFYSLTEEVLCGPVLKRIDYDRMLFLNLYLSSLVMACCLLQADCGIEEENALQKLW